MPEMPEAGLEGLMKVLANNKAVLGKFYSRPACALKGNGSVPAQCEGESAYLSLIHSWRCRPRT